MPSSFPSEPSLAGESPFPTTRGGFNIEDDVTRLEFINAIKPSCVTAQEAFGIPWGWFVAQAIQESGGYGKSDLSINAHNLYGIKGKDYFQGKVGYASFKDWNAAIQFQGWQLSQSRYLPYKPLVVAGKFKMYGDAISKAGWCPVSSPTYGTMVEQIAYDYKLKPEPAKPIVVLDVAEKFAVDNGIVDNAEDFEKNPQVDLKRVCWMIYKSRGKL
jgi:flagellum-specific peptidoglycan hydrolase FlgJ